MDSIAKSMYVLAYLMVTISGPFSGGKFIKSWVEHGLISPLRVIISKIKLSHQTINMQFEESGWNEWGADFTLYALMVGHDTDATNTVHLAIVVEGIYDHRVPEEMLL